MFDLRYHVASLAAVFLALVIGIVVGVGIADRGLVDKAQNDLLEQRVSRLQSQLDQARDQSTRLAQEQKAARGFIEDAYPALMNDRLKGRRIALVFIGSLDGKIRTSVEQTLADAGAPPALRVRALRVPVNVDEMVRKIASERGLERFVGDERFNDLGRGSAQDAELIGKALGEDLATGGDATLWDALAGQLIEERIGGGKRPVDGVVVYRSAGRQYGDTASFLGGFYRGLASSRIPAIGVESSRDAQSTVGVFRRFGISTVDDVDTPMGRVALALLLDHAKYGHYGLKPEAREGVLPPIELASTASG
jgi:Copper transport outer membrane protein, MctB